VEALADNQLVAAEAREVLIIEGLPHGADGAVGEVMLSGGEPGAPYRAPSILAASSRSAWQALAVLRLSTSISLPRVMRHPTSLREPVGRIPAPEHPSQLIQCLQRLSPAVGFVRPLQLPREKGPGPAVSPGSGSTAPRAPRLA
jgi:hypothetical protein